MRLVTALVGAHLMGALLARAESPCVEVEVLEALENGKVVFLGEVLSSTPADHAGKAVQRSQAVQALYQTRVLEEFKGARAKQYALLGDLSPDSPPPGSVNIGSGLPLTVGGKYLLFAWGDPLRIDPCPPTAELSEAEQALLRLRQHGRGVKGHLTSEQRAR